MAETQPSQSETTQQLVVFALEGEEYALPINSVREVIRYAPPRSVASNDPALRGVINLRGSIVPVYDLRPLLNLGPASGESGKIVVAALGSTLAGLLVDEVAEVLTVGFDRYEDLPAVANEAVKGVVRHGDRLIVLLDPERVAVGETHSGHVDVLGNET